MTPQRALALLITVSAGVRLIAAVSLGLGNDEAYHFLYAVNLDLSYYDHPPMLALVEYVGLSLSGAWFSPLALRIGFIALFAGSTWLLARITGRWYGAWAGFCAALALNLTGYYGLAASTFALPDGPLLFFWLLTIDRLSRALEQPGRILPWLGVGLAWGCAMLSKYHAIFLPAGTLLFLALHRPMRRELGKPGPYLAILLGLCIFSPVLVWNARNGWASFAFQGGRAIGSWTPRPDCLAVALLAQLGYFFPWIWGPLVFILVRELRNWSRLEADYERLGLCLAVVPVGVFTAIACFRPVLPHWGLIGLVSLFPALGREWNGRWAARPVVTRRWLTVGAAFPLILLGFTMLEHQTGILQRREGSRWGLFTTTTDPTADLYGWDLVATQLDNLGILEPDSPFLFTRTWYQSAQVAHATKLRRPVLCYNVDDPRGFAFWSRPKDWVGRDGVFLMINEDFLPVEFFRKWFRSSSLLADFQVERGGKSLRRVRAYLLKGQLAAFPYDFSATSLAARALIRAGGHPMEHDQPRAARRLSSDRALSR